MPWYAPDTYLEGRNLRNLYAETVWFGVLSGLTATFVPVFALRLGATAGQLGWLMALPALVNVVWLIPAARLIERQPRRLPVIITSGTLQRIGYLLLALVPLLAVTRRIELLIAVNTLITLPAAVASTAMTSLLPDLAAPERRHQVVSARWLILGATSTLAALVGGWFLDLLPVPINYQLLLGAGGLLSFLSLRYLRRIRVPDAVRLARTVEPGRRYAWQRLRNSIASVRGHPAFLRFSAASFVFYWGLHLPAALWSLFRVRDLGASDTMIGVIAVAVDAATIAGYLWWGRTGARRGDRWLLLVTALGVTGYAGVTALVPSIGWMVPTSLFGGLMWAGCNLALFNVMLAVAPAERRPTYVALYTALMNVSAAAAPLLGTALSGWVGIRWAFVIATAVRLVGVGLFWRMVPGE
jgi:MFS family permease